MSGTMPVAPWVAPVAVIDDFLPLDLAVRMREDIEAHFDPQACHIDPHQVWSYRFVAGLHTYLLTNPENIICRDRLDVFMQLLQAWSILTLGMGIVSWPSLHLYVGGCREALHNNAAHGRFRFVYSLTSDQRRTGGGEMLILREGGFFLGPLGAASAAPSLYDTIQPKFNRLVVMDDRLPSAVENIEGSMDPADGRWVLHGHLSETGTMVSGELPGDVVEQALVALFHDFAERNSARMALYQGPLVLRFVISAGGSIETCGVLVDRVVHEDPGHIEWEVLRADLVNRIQLLKFPPAPGATAVTKPLVLGVPLPG